MHGRSYAFGSLIHGMEIDDEAKALVVELYDEEELTEDGARRLLGAGGFEDAVERARGAEMMLSGNPSRFISGECQAD